MPEAQAPKTTVPRLAYIFPGQGSQYPGMGRELAANFAPARRVFHEADEALGFPLSRLCFEGRAEELQLTENTQPAILAASVAALAVLEAEGYPPPDFVAGHSLGEYSALVASGSLSLHDAVRLVRARGRYMQEAVPQGSGAMAAIIGADPETIEAACREAQQDEVCSPANINSPGQVVIAGNSAAVDRAIDLLKSRGARRTVKLKVSAPFHCALMKPAQDRLAADLQKVAFADLSTVLITNADAKATRDGSEARNALVRQVTAPVLWKQSLECIAAQGGDRFLEIGPGKVLSGLVKQTLPGAACFNVEDKASFEANQKVFAAAGF